MTAPSTTVACGRCGALNDDDFGRCIRCNQTLGKTLPADRATRRVPAPVSRGVRTGSGSEPLLGHWPAELLPAAKLLLFLNLVVMAGHMFSAFAQDPSFSTLLTGGGTLDALRYGALYLGWYPLPPLDSFMLRAEPWRLLSACFVHFGPMHLGMNMMALIYFAQLAEPAIGSVRFIIAYTVTGIGGYVASALSFVFFGTVSLTAGASGAVFGIMGLILGFLMRRRDPRWKSWFLRMVVVSLVITFVLPMNINHSAHIGGLVTGVAMGALFADGAPKPSRLWQRLLASACVLASLGALIAVRFSPYYERILAAG